MGLTNGFETGFARSAVNHATRTDAGQSIIYQPSTDTSIGKYAFPMQLKFERNSGLLRNHLRGLLWENGGLILNELVTVG